MLFKISRLMFRGARGAQIGTMTRMADSTWISVPRSAAPSATSTSTSSTSRTSTPRHAGVIRITHWITTLSFLALLLTGSEIVISHPRFYWGETGNSLTPPLFHFPIPASRSTVPTGYNYVLPDQNGWSRYLHFQSAWVLVFTGFVYLTFGLLQGHFRRNLLPARAELSWRALSLAILRHLRFGPKNEAGSWSYNVLQRITYSVVIFVLFPLVIWTGLAMSPAIASVFPAAVSILGGQQSARTIHLFVSVFLSFFLIVHVIMVCLAGFRTRMRAMITGRGTATTEHV